MSVNLRKNLLWPIILQACFINLAFAQVDEPDLKREKRLHQIYLQYNQAPTSEQVWAGAVNGKPQTYLVQKGDTLWDLSTTLFGQSDFWPKVWSLNNEKVQNPHEILPRQTIQFYPGTLAEPPQLTIAQAGAGGEETKAAVGSPMVSQSKLTENIDTPDLPENLRHPIPVGKLPESLPKWKYRSDVTVETELELSNERKIAPSVESLSYYLAAEIGESHGEIKETELGGKTAGDFQYIYVHLSKEPTEKHLLAIKDIGKVKDPVEGGSARLIEVQGEIEVLEAVNTSKSLYRAIVKKTIFPLEVGAQLIAGKIPSYSVSVSEIGKSSARVVGGEFSDRRELLAERAVIFLAGDGLDEGKTYPIYKVLKHRNDDTDVQSNDRQIGKVKVVKMSGKFATAVVIDSKEDIKIGDVTSPETQSE